VSHQGHAEHVARVLFRLISGFGDLDTTAFAASAGMNLGFDGIRSIAETLGPVAGRGIRERSWVFAFRKKMGCWLNFAC
jgi:hypothetical protein